MNDDLMKAQDVLLGRVNQICNRFGLNNMMAKLYVTLYLNNRPLSLNDMAEQLKISKASASINIRALERYGAVRRVWVKGSRRDYYAADMDIVKVIMDRVKSMAKRRLSEVDDMIESPYQILNRVNPQDKDEQEDIKLFKERLDKLKSLHIRAQRLFNLFNSGLVDKIMNMRLGR